MTTLNRIIQNSDLAEGERRKALHNLNRARADELSVLNGIFQGPETWRFAGEILRGAYVRIVDKGARYEDWRTLPSAATRSSSHRSDGDQYHVDGPLVHTVLFGKSGANTWLQLENHPIYDVVTFVGHMFDYIKYKRSGKNQGPYGSSPHAENKQPIIIQTTKAYVPIDRSSWAFKAARQPRPPGSSPFR